MKIKRILILIAVLVLTLGTSALAAPDLTENGSITVNLIHEESNTAISGAEFELYRIANAIPNGENIVFDLTDEFKNSQVTLVSEGAADSLLKYARENLIEGEVAISDEQGKVSFNELMPGAYLVVGVTIPNYALCNPFIVSVPFMGEEWVYNVDATPKVDVVRIVDVTVKKVWNDDLDNIPKEIKVELLKDKEIIHTVTLNKGNNWQHTWTGLEENDEYSVREVVPKGYTPTYSKNGNVFTITNTPKLAQTGQLNWPIPVLAGAGLVLVLGGVLLTRKGKCRG